MEHTEKIVDDIVDEITNGIIGHIAIDSVTHYVVDHINQHFGTKFEDTLEMVEFAQEHYAEITECPMCGWYVDYIECWEDSEGKEHEDVMGCPSCLKYYEE